jgi:hypothetical protein
MKSGFPLFGKRFISELMDTPLRFATVLVLFTTLAGLLRAEPRTWTNRDGRTLVAELVSIDEKAVTVRSADGRTFTIPRSTLSDADQTFLKGTTSMPAKEGRILFDERGRTLSQVTGTEVVLSGNCDLETATVTLSGAVSGTGKVTKGRWKVAVPPLDGWAKGQVSITATAALPGSQATTRMTLNFINPLDEGAKGDGTTDDASALNAALKKAATMENGIVFIPPGRNFVHGDVLRMSSCELLGAGETSVLTATNPFRSTVWAEGEYPRIRNLTVVTQLGDTKRQSVPEATAVYIRKANHFWVDAVKVKGAASAGIFNLGGGGSAESFARITRCVVEDTLADGIHNTGNAHHVRVEGNVARNNGDDCFAIVSYDAQMCHDFVVVRNFGTEGNARGVTVVGGKDVLIEDNEIRNKDAAGILVASEASWGTNLSERVIVRNNRIHGCPRKLMAMSGIFLGGQSGDLPVRDVRIEGNLISHSPCYGIHLGPFVLNTTIVGNRIENSVTHGIFLRAARDTSVQNNDITTCGENGIFVVSPASGQCLITENRISDVNGREKPEVAVIRIEANDQLSQVEVTGNRYKAGRNGVREEIVCKVPKAVVKGNR